MENAAGREDVIMRFPLLLSTASFLFIIGSAHNVTTNVQNDEIDVGMLHGRIVGGRVASNKFRKGMAHIFVRHKSGYEASCTATILGKNWLLSAAHCFQDYSGSFDMLKVRHSGAYPTEKSALFPSKKKVFWFRNVFVHKRYNNEDYLDFRNDVAVIELEDSLSGYTKSKFVDVPADQTRVIAVGYGMRSEYGDVARKLMMAPVVYRQFDHCADQESAMTNLGLSERLQICAVSVNYPAGETDTCYGDSGGPLFRIDLGTKGERKLLQVGITSFSSTACAAPGGTPWYVRTIAYKKQIKRLLRQGKYKAHFVRYSA